MIAFRQIFIFALISWVSLGFAQEAQPEDSKISPEPAPAEDAAPPPAPAEAAEQAEAPANDANDAENAAEDAPENAPDPDGGAAEKEDDELSPEEEKALDELPDAPPGIILGEVLTARSSQPIAATRVKIVETNQRTMTDNQGRFRFNDIPLGTYTLEFYAPGYQTATETTIVDDLGGSLVVANLLAVGEEANDIYALDTFDFLEEYEEPEETNQLSLDLAEGASLSSGLGKEEFSASGISDAGDAVGKLVGANVVGGKYAVVRGLGDRYTNTLVNGAQIASADPSKKAVQLDLFPSNLLQGVNIYKTFTPNLPADFAGGLIAIDTLRFPEERILDISFGTKFRENLNSTEYYAISNGRLDFLGNGTPTFQDSLDRFAPNQVPIGGRPNTPQEADALEFRSDILAGGFLASRAATPDLFDHSVTYGETFEISEDSKVGVVLAWTHSQDADAQPDIQLGRAVSAFGPIRLQQDATLFQYSEDVNFGILGSVSLQATKNHEFTATYFQSTNRSNQITQLRRDKSDIILVNNDGNPTNISINGVSTPAVAYGAGDQLQFLERQLEIMQFTGKHSLSRDDDRDGATLSWSAAYTEASENRPDSREFYFSELDFTDSRLSSLPNYNPSLGSSVLAGGAKHNPTDNGRAAQRNSLASIDEGENLVAQIDIPFYFDAEGENRVELSFGTNYNDRSRQSNGRALLINTSGQLAQNFAQNTEDSISALENLDDLSQVDGGRIANIVRPGLVSNYLGVPIGGDFTDRGEVIYNSSTENTVEASFFMASLYYDGWQLKSGVRFEEELNDARAFRSDGTLFGPPTISETSGLYPAFLLDRRWGWEKEFQTTIGFSNTIARPTLLERSNVIFFDQASQTNIAGNPNLISSDVTNFDFSFGFTPTNTDLFRVSAFHKELQNPIISVLERRAQNTVISNTNTTSGTIQGIELEYAKQFTDNWSLSTNYTFLNSSIQPGQSPSNSNVVITVEDFIGQPSHIFNANLSYNNEDLGFRANLVYNLTGSYPTLFDNVNSTVVEREEFHSLDLILAKDMSLFGGDGIVKVKVTNLLDQTDSQIYQSSGLPFLQFKPGRIISLSYSTEF